VRIISLSSVAHKFAPSGGIKFADTKSPQKEITTWARYGESKIANILFVRELARRYPSITSVAVHSGTVRTNLVTTVTSTNFVTRTLNNVVGPIVSKTPEVGVKNQLWAAVAKKGNVISGEYYTPVGSGGGASKDAMNARLAENLWEWTEKELAGYSL
jgi:retinol dehydrogenase-12